MNVSACFTSWSYAIGSCWGRKSTGGAPKQAPICSLGTTWTRCISSPCLHKPVELSRLPGQPPQLFSNHVKTLPYAVCLCGSSEVCSWINRWSNPLLGLSKQVVQRVIMTPGGGSIRYLLYCLEYAMTLLHVG